MSKNLKLSYILLFVFSAILIAFRTLTSFFGGVAINFVALMGLVFVILMANFFALVEQEKVSLELKDLYLFSKPQGENILPFVVLVILSWICPFYDTILSSMLEVYPWVNYFNQFL